MAKPLLMLLFSWAPALAFAAQLQDGRSGGVVALEAAFAAVGPGSVLVLSERHDSADHHANQLAALEELARQGHAVTVGLEFFEFPDQPAVDGFVAGRMAEAEFLSLIGWSVANPFGFYRPLALFPARHGGTTLALNAPRALTRKISREGLAALTEAERALLPQGFALGNDAYRARFEEIMGGHVPADALERYFAAQSLWDDTMASVAMGHLASHPDHVVAIIVGDFHAAYGGGLPHRLRARGASAVTVVSQVDGTGLTAEELLRETAPHPLWGPRADFVWVTP